MSSFTYSGTGFSGAIRRSLLTGTPMYSIGYGYALRGKVTTMHPEVGAVWVRSLGMGNHGDCYPVGLTPRARRVIRRAKVRHLTLRCGMTPEEAGRYLSLEGNRKEELAPVVGKLVSDGHAGACASFPSRGGRAETQWQDAHPDAAAVLAAAGSFPRRNQAAGYAAAVARATINDDLEAPVTGKGWRLVRH